LPVYEGAAWKVGFAMIRLSAIVCTYNRATILTSALESLAQQTLDKHFYEVIVVDNASTDETAAIVNKFKADYSDHIIVLAREERQGLGYARNLGFRKARGRYVAFMDDDAQATRDWLETMFNCFCTIRPEPLGVGGKILPAYDAAKPKWFDDDLEVRSFGDDARLLRRGESFSGSNMGFRRDVLETYGGFDVNVGVKGPYLSVGEETALFNRIWRDNPHAGFYYSPQLVVYHAVPKYKMTISYALKRAFLTGQVWMAQNRPSSLCGRASLLMRISVSTCLWVLRSLMRKRQYSGFCYWAATCLPPIAIEVGRLTGCLGLFIKVRQGDR
jgi:glucosyl-dolichyl phosphate glucuronosyltransferase